MYRAKAAKELTKASRPFDYAGPLTETAVLGGEPVLHREYRAGWEQQAG
jgi:hypothetical protein